jgi:hypothetical protein
VGKSVEGTRVKHDKYSGQGQDHPVRSSLKLNLNYLMHASIHMAVAVLNFEIEL